MSLKRGADWRNQAAAELMCGVLRRASIPGDVLVMLENLPTVATAVGEGGGRAHSWHRLAREGRTASAWPPEGPFGAAALRLPKAKDELDMAVHAAASVLDVGAPLWVYGANDEGAGSASRIIEPLMGPVRTVGSGGRCRVLEAVRPVDALSPRGTLAEWRRSTSLEFPGGPREWISYPGIFSHGRLDAGTRTLLEVMPRLPAAGRRILDFSCGSGVIGAYLSALEPTARLDFLDVDAVALVAVSENVPGARLIPSDGFDALDHERYDLIVSNPPYHEGKEQSGRVIERLVRGAPHHLETDGSLVLVTQRRLPLAALMGSTFNTVEVLLDAGPHRVWLGRKQPAVAR
ncbi:MAG: class I SAM-dependent methyltransferase [Gemmatimonadetes bacterium]|nr:class I SAM-dependent methyltransferase [Gemmatimonadota bacterium]